MLDIPSTPDSTANGGGRQFDEIDVFIAGYAQEWVLEAYHTGKITPAEAGAWWDLVTHPDTVATHRAGWEAGDLDDTPLGNLVLLTLRNY